MKKTKEKKTREPQDICNEFCLFKCPLCGKLKTDDDLKMFCPANINTIDADIKKDIQNV